VTDARHTAAMSLFVSTESPETRYAAPGGLRHQERARRGVIRDAVGQDQAAAFREQLSMEVRFEWLPRMAHRMMAAHGRQGVRTKVVWFYLVPFALLALIASGGVSVAAWSDFGRGAGMLAAVLAGSASVCAAAYMRVSIVKAEAPDSSASAPAS